MRSRATNVRWKSRLTYATTTHLIHKHILQLDIPVHQLRYLAQIPQPPHDLPEHHPRVVLEKRLTAVALDDVEERASGTVECDEVMCIERAH